MNRPPALSRRRFLVLAGAGLVAAGCGSSGDGGSDAAGSTDELTDPGLQPLFSQDRVIAAGIPQRIPFVLVDGGVPVTGDGGEALVTVRLDGTQIDQQRLPGRVVAHDHADGLEHDDGHEHTDQLRYYALRTTLPEPGIYDLEFDLGSITAATAVQAWDPAEIGVVLPGQPFPSVVTPTVDEPGGVAPICTRVPPCDFHSDSAADLVGTGRPMAVLVATPAYCQTTFCGPVLDVVVEAAPRHPEVAFVHAEVWANPDEVDGNIADPAIRPAPALAGLGLTYEPALFVVDASGVVVDRIDNIFDRQELEAALALVEV